MTRVAVRPRLLTKKVMGEIIRRYAGGETILDICRDADMPARSMIYYWLASDDPNRAEIIIEFQREFAVARKAHALALTDDVVCIADDSSSDTLERTAKDGSTYEVPNHEWIARSKLRVDTRLKIIERISPTPIELTGANGDPLIPSDDSKDIARRIAFALAAGMKNVTPQKPALEAEEQEATDD